MKRISRIVSVALFAMVLNLSAGNTIPSKFENKKNPFAGSKSAAAAGKALYIKYCAACHGDKGKGNGVAAASFPKPPADYTSAAFQKLSDGAIYNSTSEGKSKFMPPFKASLKEVDIWNLVTFMRTLAKPVK